MEKCQLKRNKMKIRSHMCLHVPHCSCRSLMQVERCQALSELALNTLLASEQRIALFSGGAKQPKHREKSAPTRMPPTPSSLRYEAEEEDHLAFLGSSHARRVSPMRHEGIVVPQHPSDDTLCEPTPPYKEIGICHLPHWSTCPATLSE